MRLALVLVCALSAAVPVAAVAQPNGALVREGRMLYLARCASCHGANGEGVSPTGPPVGSLAIQGAGPALRGVGAQAADFYLRTGYMPLGGPYEQPRRGKPAYPPHELDALIAYVASLGGPPVPHPHPSRGSVSEGLKLFTEDCSGCHQIAGEGGVVATNVAPNLKAATPTQIAEAVRIGPYLMPRFSRRQLSDRDLDSIIRYVRQTQHPDDRGGWGIGHIGPVPEGIVAWLLAGGALLVLTRLIGKRAE